mmetsp:Transcript_45261/g.109113  ORF Transcript_45261/g.109113 Transcript_45261/m.109113 type:complete len:134 (-) Transcript_45261:383-784(-)
MDIAGFAGTEALSEPRNHNVATVTPCLLLLIVILLRAVCWGLLRVNKQTPGHHEDQCNHSQTLQVVEAANPGRSALLPGNPRLVVGGHRVNFFSSLKGIHYSRFLLPEVSGGGHDPRDPEGHLTHELSSTCLT